MDGRPFGPNGPSALSALRYGSILLCLVGALIWGLVTWWEENRDARKEATENVELVRQYTQRLIETQTILHHAAVARALTEGEDFLRSEEFHSFLTEIEASQTVTEGMAVVAFDGNMVASSRSFPVDYRFGPRAYMDAIAAGDELFLDRLLLEPSGQDALVIASPFVTEGMSGVIVSGVAVSAIRDFLSGVTAGVDGQAASLIRRDGKLLVRHIPSVPMMLGEDAPARLAIAQASRGLFDAVAASDGVFRTYAFTQLGNLPVYATFGVPKAQIRARWLTRVMPVWALLATLAFFTSVMVGFARRSLAARFLAEEEAKRRAAAETLADQRAQMMQEINHRVKNNLALVEAMIGTQMRKGGVDGHELRLRIHAISDVHDLLYRTGDAGHVDLGALLEKVARSGAIIPAEAGVGLSIDLEEVIMIDAARATPLALAAVEILTNSIKHAFAGRQGGDIAILLRREGQNGFLEIRDNGNGFSNLPARRSGLQIIEAFSVQIGGRMERVSENGTCYRLWFPLSDPEKAAPPPL